MCNSPIASTQLSAYNVVTRLRIERGDYVSVVSKNIKRIISEGGLKQKVIAERCGYSEQEFSAMMCGRKKIYADENIPTIARALGVTPNDLFIAG